MSTQAAAPPAQGRPANSAPREEQSNFRQIISVVQKALFFYMISQLILRYFSPKQEATTVQPVPAAPDTVQAHVAEPGQPDPFLLPPASLSPAWPVGLNLTMQVYLSTSPTGDVFSHQWTRAWRPDQEASILIASWEDITFGDWNDKREMQMNVTLPDSVQRNGSMWADIFLLRDGASPDPTQPSFNASSIHHVRKQLTRYLPRAKVRKEKNLLGGTVSGGDLEGEAEEEIPDFIASHWHEDLTIALVSDPAALPATQLPAPVLEHVHVTGQRDSSGKVGFYKPIVFPNDFWHLRSQHFEINTTTPIVPLALSFQPLSYFKFQMYATLTRGFDEAAKQQGSAELDEIKRMLVETNPWFLGLTFTVSILHVLFEFLAFKNDVVHWRNKKELVGVSVRTIVTNVVVQAIILLYLMDNNADTSWMILMGQGVGMLIEAWKITKAVDIRLVPTPAGSTLPYWISIKDKHVLSEEEKRTQEYDKLAFRYVSYVAIPLLAGYTVYSLLYETHRGWYSFIISTLTSFVYMFGFVQLVPQLIINYKLKSVAHMPMKAMIYKTLSTVVDDLFAFCIKMPILHRLACFRDDVVFLVFLYQRWIYRIDPKRINEFGQVMETDEKTAETKETKKTK